MKTMMIFLLMVFTVSNLKAQKELKEMNQLDEAIVTYRHNVKVTGDLGDATLDVKEDYKGQFHDNPVKFCDETFDIVGLINSVDSDKYNRYEITFNNRKGYIRATYDDVGALLKTSQKFRNIILPHDIRQKLFRDYEGWTMTKNKYTARGEGNRISKAKYRIRMSKGNTSKIVKINMNNISSGRIAGN